MTGGVPSLTVYVCWQLALLPQSSVTVYVRVTVPLHGVPTRGPSAEDSMRSWSQLSEAAPPRPMNAAIVVAAAGISSSHWTATVGGQEIVGFVASSTVKVWRQDALLPASSVTVYVRVTVPPQAPPESGASDVVRVRSLSQLSEAAPPAAMSAATVAAAVGMSVRHSTVALGGHVIDGTSASTTVTLCAQLVVLPATSVAVQVTTVKPSGKVEGALFPTVTPGQLSEAVAEPRATPLAVQIPASVLAVIGPGHAMAGGSVSRTVTVNEQELEFPQASVAV